jgi:ribonuclease PH
MRPILFERNYVKHPAGSCLACFGDTKVICTASIEPNVPSFLENTNSGWLTAEYSMLPGSTAGGRKKRDGIKRDGRGIEIKRLIGRSLRAAVHLTQLGSITIVIDCDVIQADGGTRTAAISGGWVALYDALSLLASQHGVSGAEYYLKGQLAAVSVGICDGKIICDLDYAHDSQAEVDMNVVKLERQLIEVQGTGEQGAFSRGQLDEMLDAADEGIAEIFFAQRKALGMSDV